MDGDDDDDDDDDGYGDADTDIGKDADMDARTDADVMPIPMPRDAFFYAILSGVGGQGEYQAGDFRARRPGGPNRGQKGAHV